MEDARTPLEHRIDDERSRIATGGAAKYHEKNASVAKLFCRDRIAHLIDEGSFVEDAMFANALDAKLPADGVVTGSAQVNGRTVVLMANDSTVKAGSWGKRTVEKILRIQETALRLQCPMYYLVDSAGARITDQIEMFPGRRGAGRIFHNQCRMSGQVPQICLLFGPSAAGGAYIPAFCDVVVMVDKNASMYLGSPRMAEMVIGEKVTLEEMGGAKMHCSVSGCGDVLVKSEREALDWGRAYLACLPQNCNEQTAVVEAKEPASGGIPIAEIIPTNQNKSFDMMKVLGELIDEDSWIEIKKRFAKEILTGFARMGGRTVGIVASQPKQKGGVLFVDSADKAARFITICDAFNIPLLFLMDVPGFMIGTKVEREGIIRAGAKMVMAMSEASVPKISVVVRKAYGAGLYAFCGPGFEPDCCIALPGAMIAVMGPEAAVNAVFANKIADKPEEDRPAFIAQLREEYEKDIDVERLGAELVVDDIVAAHDLRQALVDRFTVYASKRPIVREKKRSVTPV